MFGALDGDPVAKSLCNKSWNLCINTCKTSFGSVQTDRLCYIKSELPKPLFYSCRLETGIQKVGGNIRILGRIRALYSQSDFRGKY
jgi:hypothetical protein